MNELMVFWTHGFVISVIVLATLVGICIQLPDTPRLPASLRRRRIAAAAAVEFSGTLEHEESETSLSEHAELQT